ncbi:signal peptidase II [Thermohalobacter berrensis]|uniref:Lipoprotein signal peptidase n=1 Tax=Thermohalobacter berrensis TaxID=99594 RepID=A0A419TA49_9FIRM|nr:signal peptidase II [Thermohalobacter berrensis]RKD34338.1 signal peptidase II [Thermohalobacter berrensis]
MLYFLSVLSIILIDQISKYYAVKLLKGSRPYVIIEKFLQFNYVENYGAAFGILQNKKLFFIITTSLILIGIIAYMIMNKNLTKLMKASLIMIIGGAIGNFIDRVRLGYVVDFIDVKFGTLYDYPVFNLADSFIVVATIIIVYLVLFNKHEIV